jgi:hypothetical protein
MIILVPSKRVVADTGLNFDIINIIINTIVYTKKRIVIRVLKAHNKSTFSAYYPSDNKILIKYDSDSTIYYIISAILHEVRHVVQSEKFKKLKYVYKNYKEYFNSPEEKDARKFEKLSRSFYSSYRNLVKLTEKYRKNNLEYFDGFDKYR